MEDLVITYSVTDRKCFDDGLGRCLSKVGVRHTIIETSTKLSWVDAANSIIKHENIQESKYILFIHQDVEFLEDNWGKKIIEWCDSLPDLGYAGIECVTREGESIGCGFTVGHMRIGRKITSPMVVETCDCGVAIIPTKLFLERQFDSSILSGRLWYPTHEDYACWVQFVKNLKVYCLPIQIWHKGCHNIFNWKRAGYSTPREYLDKEGFTEGWYRLNKKWGRQINTSVHTADRRKV